MKPAFRREVLVPLFVFASDELGMPWEFMARKKKVAEYWAYVVREETPSQGVVPELDHT
ncbi:hypothetical protein [Thioclava electrotropha]|uniref:Uncharacterized protein n=1 Tax=Thioclava electrotropha TaxID=1549850 RepID=A0ABX6YS96_9RHOB|nr:hypothetical protein [Thioclava electrotropha]QPZ90665.1 hypothetical protein AKL02_006965 [Thioclava electrotropha]